MNQKRGSFCHHPPCESGFAGINFPQLKNQTLIGFFPGEEFSASVGLHRNFMQEDEFFLFDFVPHFLFRFLNGEGEGSGHIPCLSAVIRPNASGGGGQLKRSGWFSTPGKNEKEKKEEKQSIHISSLGKLICSSEITVR